MAGFILQATYIEVDGRDISGSARAIQLALSGVVVETTPFNAQWLEFTPDKRASWDVALTLLQDFDDGEVGGFLWDRVLKEVAIKVRKTHLLPAGPSNASFEGQAVLLEYPIFDNEVGAVATVDPVLKGTGPLSRVT